MSELGLLYRYLPTELVPPDEVWGRLVKALDDDKHNAFREMETLEIPPPMSAWENIASALEENNTSKTVLSFTDSFSNMEISPPSFVWDEIEKSLDKQETLIKKIGGKSKMVRIVVTGLAIAACLSGIVFSVLHQADNQEVAKKSVIAIVNKTDVKPNQNNAVSKKLNKPAQTAVINHDTTKEADKNLALAASDFATEDERILNLKKYNNTQIADINSTNNKVASKTGKLKDADGNVIDRLEDYNTNGNYIAAIGPNGNSVNVSTKLLNMIEFFQEDSVANKPEEYLDKVMRESNVWRQKFIDWRKKVDNADADPSKMNFIDPIDLIRFFQKNK